MADDSGAPLKSLGRHIGVSVSSKASMVAWCPPLTNHSRQIAEVQPCLPCIATRRGVLFQETWPPTGQSVTVVTDPLLHTCIAGVRFGYQMWGDESLNCIVKSCHFSEANHVFCIFSAWTFTTCVSDKIALVEVKNHPCDLWAQSGGFWRPPCTAVHLIVDLLMFRRQP